MARHSVDTRNSTAAFSVFADSTPKPAKAQSKASMPGQKSLTRGCAVLQELNLNMSKPFTLSPNSQICAEKENFDPVKNRLESEPATSKYAKLVRKRLHTLGIRSAA
ncbi:hypothetical protein IWW56_004392 [Coemansia sp. RSA 2131]|nr:hypothetical protein IWW56_004392 [Coemansia sp. RSA 2131]